LIFAFLLLALLAAIPLFLSIVTWKWLGGKETEAVAAGKEEQESNSVK
jgi:hypothetical protein